MAALALVLTYYAAVDAVAGATRTRAPETALRYQPDDALAQANLASMLLLANGTDRATRERAAALARRSLAGLALNPVALRVAIATETSPQRVEAALRLSEKMSRRDIATQLMLIETAVQADDADAALSHYDIALRVNPDMGTTLYPVLASAAAGEAVDPSFARLFRSNPPWADGFVRWAANYAPNAAEIVPLIRSLPAGSAGLSTGNVQQLIGKLAAERHFATAFDLYKTQAPRASSRLWNVGTSLAYPPLDWRIANTGDLTVNLSEPGGPVDVEASSETSQTALDRVLPLPPGRYLLIVEGSSSVPENASAPEWQIACATAPEFELARLAMPTQPAGRAEHRASFKVLPDCPFQWLRLKLRPGTQSERQSATVNKLRVVRLGGN